MSVASRKAKLCCIALLLAAFSTVLAVEGVRAAEVEGTVVTEAEGRDALASTWIRATHGDARVDGKVSITVFIKGDVVTRARGPRAEACTSIGSIGGCALRARGDLLSIDRD